MLGYSNVEDVVLKWGDWKGFHEFVRKLKSILNNPKDFLEYFVVKLFVVMGGTLRLPERS